MDQTGSNPWDFYKQELIYFNWQIRERYRDRARVDGKRDLLYEVLRAIEAEWPKQQILDYIQLEMAIARAKLKEIDHDIEWRKERWYKGKLTMGRRLLKELEDAPDYPASEWTGQAQDEPPILD